MTCYSPLLPPPCYRWRRTRNGWAPRSASFAILHTWGQNLLLHPHIHCVLPAGGLAPDHNRWISAKRDFFLPIPVLRKRFRGKFSAGLKRLRQRGKLCRTGPGRIFSNAKQWAKLLRRLHLRRWVVYAKAPFGGPMQVLRYLGRYTHRVAISNHRLLAFDGEQVRFQWKDYAHGRLVTGSRVRLRVLDAELGFRPLIRCSHDLVFDGRRDSQKRR
jgi:hypothetical protein